MNPIHYSFQKIMNGNHFSYWTYWHTYRQLWYYMPPTENGGGIKTMVFTITTYPFTNHNSPYVPAVYKMSNFCAMIKEYMFSFELHSNMLNLHWNGDVFNKGSVISPRTEVLHACLSPNRQNLITLASGEKWLLFRIRSKDYNTSLIIWETK